MLSKIQSLGCRGVTGYAVSVECHVSNGLPGFDIVGLPDAAVKEARERVRSAIKTNGMKFPVSRLTVNLAPADTRKAGTLYDLPVLLGILCATGEIRQPPATAAFFGEVSLAGEIRPVTGALTMALAAEQIGQVLGPDVLGQLARSAGMDSGAAGGALAQILPQVVDAMTPDGRLPQQGTDLGAMLPQILGGLLGGSR